MKKDKKNVEKKEKVTIILLACLVVIGLSSMTYFSRVTKDSKKFKKEYESLNGKKTASKETIRKLSISSANPMKYSTAKKIVKKIDKKETFVVYFGFAECPWCRSIIETLLKTARNNRIETIYYVDVQNIRDTYELGADGIPTLRKVGTDDYYELEDRLFNVLDDYTLTDEKGEMVEVGTKRIYAPNIVAVVKGEPKRLETGISPDEEDPYMKLTDEMVKDTREAFNEIFKYMKK